MLETVFFNLFAGLSILSAMGVVLARNTMHSVMFLIFCFFNAAGLFFLLDAEFIGIIMILIYVGAVMVLFTFVVMMLEIHTARLREGFLQYLPMGGLIAIVLMIEFIGAATSGVFSSGDMATAEHLPQSVNNTVEIGQILYTQYLLGFEIAAIILLVALIGAIVLTLRTRKDAKYQKISAQVNVRKEDRMRKVRM
ncbi:MAG: NADH:ubiquinone oxidoreductase subunit J [Zetaproteobacteria bacterium CG12_big_fil_rev_8_21_14_0_65_54_13]|nr:MAG: NADH:ubiquinone oxidoreductase subunit J [Zetaproteobacteria bacterium CG12_big_fil_rev_8_21_14_0_65_54_13]PIX54131.1 MAG: NADH:ubiquinone oxidoreductase subunit J [Zetaproteobacteria bacterium CG_4_10_14_3_um_filter_54_28]PJA31053.1 MAG: NADH:ubiquinone oxidoreductase subunit J [Zetaproteobacteria bacterium CG_4_9_14_3_um_filter_54_145]